MTDVTICGSAKGPTDALCRPWPSALGRVQALWLYQPHKNVQGSHHQHQATHMKQAVLCLVNPLGLQVLAVRAFHRTGSPSGLPGFGAESAVLVHKCILQASQHL